MAWRPAVPCERPHFPRSSGQGCDVGDCDEESEDEREGYVHTYGSCIRERILEGRGRVYCIFQAANGKKHSDHHGESEGYSISA